MDKITKYVICEKTIKELIDIVENNTDRYCKIKLYEHAVDIGDISEEQERIQRNNRWQAEQGTDIRLYEAQLYELIQKLGYEEIIGGCKENLPQTIYDDVLKTKIRVVSWVHDGGKEFSSVNSNIEIGDQHDTDFVYSKNIKEFEEQLKCVSYRNSFAKEGEKVLLERFEVGVYSYAFDNIEKNASRLIKKFIRNELTYCIKANKIIIPDEYIAKGKEGIRGWREIKSSNNKNNSMEKRMLKQVFADKKALAYRSMDQILSKISNMPGDWSIPSITVDGKWNQTKINKLITKLADTKNRQKFIDLPEDEMIKKFKDYWKDRLMEIYKEIDELEVLKIKE